MTQKMTAKVAGLGMLVAVLAGFSAPAQAADVRADVPFSFTMNGNALPPGTYSLSTQGGGLFVRPLAGRGAIALTIALQSSRELGGKLVFFKYGDEYVLRQVWTGGGIGREIPASRHERQLQQAARQGKAVASVERVVLAGLLIGHHGLHTRQPEGLALGLPAFVRAGTKPAPIASTVRSASESVLHPGHAVSSEDAPE